MRNEKNNAIFFVRTVAVLKTFLNFASDFAIAGNRPRCECADGIGKFFEVCEKMRKFMRFYLADKFFIPTFAVQKVSSADVAQLARAADL